MMAMKLYWVMMIFCFEESLWCSPIGKKKWNDLHQWYHQGWKIQTNGIYHRPKSKAWYICGIQTIESYLSHGCLMNFISNEDNFPHDLHILNTTFRLRNRLHKPFDKLSSKDQYSILLFNRKVRVSSKLYWLQKFDDIDNKWMIFKWTWWTTYYHSNAKTPWPDKYW